MGRQVKYAEDLRLQGMLFFVFRNIHPHKMIAVMLKQDHIPDRKTAGGTGQERMIIKADRIMADFDPDSF